MITSLKIHNTGKDTKPAKKKKKGNPVVTGISAAERVLLNPNRAPSDRYAMRTVATVLGAAIGATYLANQFAPDMKDPVSRGAAIAGGGFLAGMGLTAIGRPGVGQFTKWTGIVLGGYIIVKGLMDQNQDPADTVATTSADTGAGVGAPSANMRQLGTGDRERAVNDYVVEMIRREGGTADYVIDERQRRGTDDYVMQERHAVAVHV